MSRTVEEVRAEFPLLTDRDVIYLDNGATSQKPQRVLDAVAEYYTHNNANPMRGLYDLSVDATEAYENARKAAADFIGADDPDTIIFTRNASESLNLVAYSYGMHFLSEGDEIIVSIAEHHSNFLPWQQIAKARGAVVKFYECAQDGSFDLDVLEGLMTDRTKLLAVTQISNLFGRVNDVKAMAQIAHRHNAVIVVDGAQSVPHVPVNVTEMDADFFAFSGHKMYAPMGIGVLYGKKELLESMPPFLYGGEMIEIVTKERATFAPVPHKFEAGTVNAGGAVGLHAAIDFINLYGWDFIEAQEEKLTRLAFEGMQKIPHVKIIGADDYREHHGILTFTLEGVHPHDVAAIMSDEKIAVRAGHHCAQPLHKHLGLMSTTRASFAFYNNEEDIDRFLAVLTTIRKRMGYDD